MATAEWIFGADGAEANLTLSEDGKRNEVWQFWHLSPFGLSPSVSTVVRGHVAADASTFDMGR